MNRPVTSASNIHRRALCPGSERMEAGLPDEESVQSREGELLHQYDANPKLERAVLKQQQRDLLRISSNLDDFVFSRVAEQFNISKDEPFQEGNEKELLALQTSQYQTLGHCDRWRYYPKIRLLVIIDKKFGYKVTTPAAANYQLRIYAIGGSEEWHVDHIVVAITQPRLPYEQRVTMAVYNVDDLAAAEDELISVRQNSAELNAPLVAGEEQCRYCKAKLVCPAYQAKVSEGLAVITAGNGSVAKREADAERTLAECNDDQLDGILVAIQFADFIKDLAREEARRRISNGQMSNWKLGKATQIRKIIDAARAIALLSLRGDLSKDEIMACCSPSITKLQDALREKKGLTYKDAKQLIDDTIGDVIELEDKKQPLLRQ